MKRLNKIAVSAGAAGTTFAVAMTQLGIFHDLALLADRAVTLGCFFGLGDVEKTDKINQKSKDYLRSIANGKGKPDN